MMLPVGYEPGRPRVPQTVVGKRSALLRASAAAADAGLVHKSRQPEETVSGFPEGVALDKEIRSPRSEHNFALDGAGPVILTILREHIGKDTLKKTPAGLPNDAKAFWYITVDQNGARSS